MIFDTHCHYNLDPLFNDWETYWQAAQDQGVKQSTIIGTDLQTSQRALDMARGRSNIHAVVGLHPSEFQDLVGNQPHTSSEELEQDAQEQLDQLEMMCQRSGIKGIGETGLDYYRLPDSAAQVGLIKKLQVSSFIKHLELARKLDVPVVVHVRDQSDDAYWDTLSILKDHYWGEQPLILHCVSGPVEYIQSAVEMGAYLGVAGNVTYKNADHIRSLVKISPANRILLETDAPFLPPHPHRGQVCEPWMIKLTAEYLQEVLGLDLDAMYQTSCQLFSEA